jgi:hypothetical protein
LINNEDQGTLITLVVENRPQIQELERLNHMNHEHLCGNTNTRAIMTTNSAERDESCSFISGHTDGNATSRQQLRSEGNDSTYKQQLFQQLLLARQLCERLEDSVAQAEAARVSDPDDAHKVARELFAQRKQDILQLTSLTEAVREGNDSITPYDQYSRLLVEEDDYYENVQQTVINHIEQMKNK